MKSGNNPNVHQLVDGWIKCGMSVQRNNFQPLKGREVQMHAVTWMNLANMLNEISQIQKTIYVWFHLYEVFKTGKSTETEEWFPGLGMEEEWVTANGHRVSLGCEKMFYNREFSLSYTQKEKCIVYVKDITIENARIKGLYAWVIQKCTLS